MHEDPASPAPVPAPTPRADVPAPAGPNVTVLRRDARTFHLLGTAHVSPASVEEVHTVIRALRPDTVCVELCEPRYKSMVDPEHWRNLDIFQVIRQGRTLFLMANLALGAWQRRMGEQLGVQPGAELLAAVETAKEVGAEVVLIDREIHVTLRRAWASVPFFKRMGLATAVLESAFTTETVSAEQIEELKTQAQHSDVMSDFARALPEVKITLIDERDRYMIDGLRNAPGNNVVAVVGAGHVPGMALHFDDPVDRAALSVIPKPAAWVGIVKWIIPALVLGAFVWGWQKNEGRTLEEMLWAWILPNSIAAALLTAAVGGRPLTILTAFLASPITSLNPLIGTGMVAGLVEAWLRKPRVDDAQNLSRDIQTVRGAFRNPFSRVLIVVLAATIGSALGAWIGAGWVLSLLNSDVPVAG